MKYNLLLQEVFEFCCHLSKKKTQNFTLIDQEKDKIEQFFTPGTLSMRLPD